MGRHFYKMSGSGNDFVFTDGREHPVSDWPAAAVREVCDRRTGVGADGVVVIDAEGPGAVRMVYINADGSRAGMCGNAALCSTRLAARLGLAPPTGMAIHSDTGVLQTRCVGPGWSAELLLPDFRAPEPVDLPLDPGERWMSFCDVGVPHLIIGVDEAEGIDVETRGRALRNHMRFAPAGANVNFIARAPGGADHAWKLRTYERGVEAETLACGTGTVGAAFALAARGVSELPVRVRAWGGNVYSVAGSLVDGMAKSPWLCGEGRLVFEGRLE